VRKNLDMSTKDKAVTRRARAKKSPGGAGNSHFVTKAQVKQLISVPLELKVFDESAHGTVTTTGTVFWMSNLGTGAQYNERKGNRVLLRELSISLTAVAGDLYNNVRFICFVWYPDDNVDVPTVASVLDTSTSADVYPPQYLLNWQLRKKYRILFERRLYVENFTFYNGSAPVYNGGSGSGRMFAQADVKMKLHHEIVFNGVANNHGEGQIYMIVVSDSAVTPNPSYSWAHRFLFTDA